MPRLPTQPKSKPGAPIIPLRSGFFALPFSSSASPSSDNLYIFARLHHAEESDASNQLFVTSLPLGTTSVALTKVFSALYPSNPPTSVLLLPSLSQPTLHSSAAAPPAPIDPLFPAPNPSHSPSAILTFSSPPSLPPPSKRILFPTPSLSYLAASADAYDAARPHNSTIIAHSDSWMSAYDARKIAASASSLPEFTPAPAAKKAKKPSKNAPVAPLPGSAAYALAAHAAQQALAADRTRNPDAVVEEEWTTVSRGGRHGKSLLPTGTKESVLGYGGVQVGVAKRREVVEGEEPPETKVIVGEGFYRFKKEEGRRAGAFRRLSGSRRTLELTVSTLCMQN